MNTAGTHCRIGDTLTFLDGNRKETRTVTGFDSDGQALVELHGDTGHLVLGCHIRGVKRGPNWVAAAPRRHIVLVGCCAEKRSGLSVAADLYQSQLYRKARAWAEARGDDWAILSAAYGIIIPTTRMMSYDHKMQDKTPEQRQAWNKSVAAVVEAMYGDCRITMLAGESYAGWTDSVSCEVSKPLEGMGIGQRLQWLTRALHFIQPDPEQINLFSGVSA